MRAYLMSDPRRVNIFNIYKTSSVSKPYNYYYTGELFTGLIPIGVPQITIENAQSTDLTLDLTDTDGYINELVSGDKFKITYEVYHLYNSDLTNHIYETRSCYGTIKNNSLYIVDDNISIKITRTSEKGLLIKTNQQNWHKLIIKEAFSYPANLRVEQAGPSSYVSNGWGYIKEGTCIVRQFSWIKNYQQMGYFKDYKKIGNMEVGLSYHSSYNAWGYLSYRETVDGTTSNWIETNVLSSNYSTILYINNIWYVTNGNSSTLYSLDGKTWTPVIIDSSPFSSVMLTEIMYANNLWVALGYSDLSSLTSSKLNGIYTSPDGMTWTRALVWEDGITLKTGGFSTVTEYQGPPPTSLHYIKGKWWCALKNNLLCSTDGITWEPLYCFYGTKGYDIQAQFIKDYWFVSVYYMSNYYFYAYNDGSVKTLGTYTKRPWASYFNSKYIISCDGKIQYSEDDDSIYFFFKDTNITSNAYSFSFIYCNGVIATKLQSYSSYSSISKESFYYSYNGIKWYDGSSSCGQTVLQQIPGGLITQKIMDSSVNECLYKIGLSDHILPGYMEVTI